MMDFVKKIVSIVGFFILVSCFPACKEEKTGSVADMPMVTVAFKMPVDGATRKKASVPAEKEKKGVGNEDAKKALPAHPDPSPEKSEDVAALSKYSGEGKVDPFIPLIKNEAVKIEEPVRRPRTPLEKLDYSQMKLVAIVARGDDLVAMVEEAGGKGHIVLEGTYIGRNGGVVSEIWEDRIIVLERVKDFKGDIITRTQEIKLNKTEDEGI
ncbi:Pilus assembly protein, PilP [Desulfocicer vacuolatum DSM 3385]|uniref:Pilus assembly protein, PilP n=1 Tax=Desulfocicer vacuolatum DSM 3385 TaxID=1121400 RepID=A0A1W1ZUQ8_9BACT|nr:pilus assembly protein PilP [Desulfocicer vacuolatum]SMC51972.1 Pilus assembly protein, PilP [Desulfocicer vacuolatum DSM 3385]